MTVRMQVCAIDNRGGKFKQHTEQKFYRDGSTKTVATSGLFQFDLAGSGVADCQLKSCSVCSGPANVFISANNMMVTTNSEIRQDVCYQCTNGYTTLQVSFRLLVADQCNHFYSSSIKPLWDGGKIIVAHLINPGEQVRNYLWQLYKLKYTDSCPQNRVDIFESDCSTPIGLDPSTSSYLTSNNGPGQDVHIAGTAETPYVYSRSDRLSLHELCFKAYAWDPSINALRMLQFTQIYETGCLNHGKQLFFDKFNATGTHADKKVQTILVGAKSSLHNYPTPETGVVQDGYFQLYGEFESNTGPQGSPCTHTYRVKQNTKFYINKVGPGDWRVQFIDPNYLNTVGRHTFNIWITPEDPPNYQENDDVAGAGGVFGTIALTLFIICEPTETFKELPGDNIPKNSAVIPPYMIMLTSMQFNNYQIFQPPVTINEWTIGSSQGIGQTGCQVSNQVFTSDKVSAVTQPSSLTPTTDNFKVIVKALDKWQHGVYQFVIKTTLTNVPAAQTIFSSLITYRVGCGFNMAATYQPFIESSSEITNLDETVWSYVDYSQIPLTSQLISSDITLSRQGGHLMEVGVSCGVNDNLNCFSGQIPQINYNEQIVKNHNVASYDYRCNTQFSAVTNTDINAISLSSEVSVTTIKTDIYDYTPIPAKYLYSTYKPKINFSCPKDKVITFKLLVQLPNTIIPAYTVGYQNHFFTKDFTINCVCNYPEMISVPPAGDFISYLRIYVTQVESNQILIPSYGWSNCLRQRCPYNSTSCAYPPCDTPCKPLKPQLEIIDNQDLVSNGVQTLYKDIDPAAFDETLINQGIITVNKFKIGYYYINVRRQTEEAPTLMTNIGNGPIPVQGTAISPMIYIEVICGPIYRQDTNFGNYTLPGFHLDQEPYIISNGTIVSMFQLKDGRWCPEEQPKYAIYYDKDCLSKVPMISPIEQNPIYINQTWHLYINRQQPRANTFYYICAYFDHLNTNKNSTQINVMVCGDEKIIQKVANPVVQASFVRSSTYPGKGSGIQVILKSEYYYLFESSEPNFCPITNIELIWRPNSTYIDELLPGKFGMIDENGDILISTADLVDEKNLGFLHNSTFIRYKTIDQPQAGYARLNITIYDLDYSKVRNITNTAPFFLKKIESKVKLHIDDKPWSRIIAFPDVYDIHGDKIYVKIAGDFDKRIMDFSLENKVLRILELNDEDYRTYNIQIILYDDYGAQNVYSIELTLRKGFDFFIDGDRKTRNEFDKFKEINDLTIPKIKQISYNGELFIEFNKDMLTDFNQTVINSTDAIDIYVQPYDGRTNIDNINLTWHLTSFEKKQLMIQLNFTNYEFISPNDIQDRLVVYFNWSEFFVSKDKRLEIKEESKTLIHKIRKQVRPNWLTKAALNTAGALDDTVKFGLVLTFVMTSQIPQAMRVLVSFMNSLQIIIHLPILRIIIPGIVLVYLSILLEITQFDVLDPEWTTMLFLKFDFEMHEQLSNEQFSQIIDMGYETCNIILSMGSIGIFIVGYFFLLMILGILKVVQRYTQKLNKVTKYLQEKLIFGLFITLLFDSYIFTLFSAIQNFLYPLDTMNGEYIAKFYTYIMLIFLILVTPILIVWILTRDIEKLKSKEFKTTWGAAYVDVRTSKKVHLFYYPIFILRRIVMISSAFLLVDHPTFQIQIVILGNILITEFNGYHCPLQDPFRNKLELINESYIQVLSIIFMVFTDWGPEEDIKNLYGWAFVYILISYCFTNLIYTAINVIENLILIFKKYFRRLQYKYPRFFCKKKKQPSMKYLPKLNQDQVDAPINGQENSEQISDQNKDKNTQDSQQDEPNMDKIMKNVIESKNRYKFRYKKAKIIHIEEVPQTQASGNSPKEKSFAEKIAEIQNEEAGKNKKEKSLAERIAEIDQRYINQLNESSQQQLQFKPSKQQQFARVPSIFPKNSTKSDDDGRLNWSSENQDRLEQLRNPSLNFASLVVSQERTSLSPYQFTLQTRLRHQQALESLQQFDRNFGGIQSLNNNQRAINNIATNPVLKTEMDVNEYVKRKLKEVGLDFEQQ